MNCMSESSSLYRDRLTRFGYLYIEELFKAYGVRLLLHFKRSRRTICRS